MNVSCGDITGAGSHEKGWTALILSIVDIQSRIFPLWLGRAGIGGKQTPYIDVNDNAEPHSAFMEPEVQQKALVLDDNPACLLATSELVASIGYQVREVETTAAAIEAIEHESFDLVVSDISLPGDLNGAQLAQILKQRFPEMPVILMTGHYELKYRIRLQVS